MEKVEQPVSRKENKSGLKNEFIYKHTKIEKDYITLEFRVGLFLKKLKNKIKFVATVLIGTSFFSNFLTWFYRTIYK